MRMVRSVRYFVFCLLFAVSQSAKFPPYVTPCHKDDPDLNGCIKKQTEIVKPHLANGIPEMGLPAMNPMVIPELEISKGQNFRVKFTDSKLYDFHNFNVENLDFDLDKNHVQIEVTFPLIYVECMYEVDGRLLFLDLKGEGPGKSNYTGAHAKLEADLGRRIKKGKEHFKIEKSNFNIDLGKPTFWFENLFGDNKELNDQTMKLINENIDEILGDLKPAINNAVAQLIRNMFEKVFNKFSVDEMFP